MGKKESRKVNVGLQLLIQNPGSADPVLPIGWCMQPKTLETIERHKIQNPHLLIVVARKTPCWRYPKGKGSDGVTVYDYEEVRRVLVPLAQGLEYVPVNKAGAYKVFATIVGDDRSVDDLRSYWMGGGRRNILTINGDFTPPGACLREAAIDVEVGAEFFAHEPPEWERMWVDLWHLTPSKDECQFRRRKFFFAYTLQPFVMAVVGLLIAVARLLGAALLLLGGYRDITWRGIPHPFKRGFYYDVTCKVKSPANSIFFTNRADDKFRWYLVPACPYLPIVITLIRVLSVGHPFHWLPLLLLFAKVYLWVFGIGFLFFWAFKLALGSIEATPEEELQARKERKFAAALAKQQAELEYLQCHLVQGAPSVKNLPHPGIRLRYLALKASLCRQFST